MSSSESESSDDCVEIIDVCDAKKTNHTKESMPVIDTGIKLPVISPLTGKPKRRYTISSKVKAQSERKSKNMANINAKTRKMKEEHALLTRSKPLSIVDIEEVVTKSLKACSINPGPLEPIRESETSADDGYSSNTSTGSNKRVNPKLSGRIQLNINRRVRR